MPSVLYANNDAVSVLPGASAVNEGPCLEAMMTEPVLPPPVAYANMEPSHYSNKLDDLLRDEDESQHHLYINVGPEAVEVTFNCLLPSAAILFNLCVNDVTGKAADSGASVSFEAGQLRPA